MIMDRVNATLTRSRTTSRRARAALTRFATTSERVNAALTRRDATSHDGNIVFHAAPRYTHTPDAPAQRHRAAEEDPLLPRPDPQGRARPGDRLRKQVGRRIPPRQRLAALHRHGPLPACRRR